MKYESALVGHVPADGTVNNMYDDSRTIKDAEDEVRKFCEERNWDQFHNPKDLAIGIATEASELLQLFRFKTPAQCSEMMSNPEGSEKVREELADVFYFVLRFAQMNGIDLYSSLERKIAKNDEKYPVSLSRDSNKKYDEF